MLTSILSGRLIISFCSSWECWLCLPTSLSFSFCNLKKHYNQLSLSLRVKISTRWELQSITTTKHYNIIASMGNPKMSQRLVCPVIPTSEWNGEKMSISVHTWWVLPAPPPCHWSVPSTSTANWSLWLWIYPLVRCISQSLHLPSQTPQPPVICIHFYPQIHRINRDMSCRRVYTSQWRRHLIKYAK